MSGCVLRASGENFSAKEFLAAHSLPADAAWENAFNSPVSDRDGDDLAGQVEDAIAFLTEHAAALQALMSDPAVAASLDFGLWQSNSPSQTVVFPPELVTAAGKLGIGVSVSLYAVAP